jgi:hypothetical protein
MIDEIQNKKIRYLCENVLLQSENVFSFVVIISDFSFRGS